MSESPRVLVAISRQMGAGGAYVGQALARRTGLRYVDREILQEAARVLGREDKDLENLEERVASMWSRMASVLAWGAPESAYVPPPMPTIYEDELFAVESEIIRGIAEREDAVFVGRAAGWVLHGQPGLFSIFLHAAEPTRVERIKSAYSIKNTAEALAVLRRSDQQRSRFVQSVRGADWLASSNYQMCFDTGAIALDEVVDVVASVLSHRLPAVAAGR